MFCLHDFPRADFSNIANAPKPVLYNGEKHTINARENGKSHPGKFTENASKAEQTKDHSSIIIIPSSYAATPDGANFMGLIMGLFRHRISSFRILSPLTV